MCSSDLPEPNKPEPAKPEPVAAVTPGASQADQADALCRRALACGNKKCDCSVQALLDAYNTKLDPAVWQALQAVATAMPAKQWLTPEAAVVSNEEEERGPAEVSAEAMESELKRQGATAWKPLTPKEYTYKVGLHNPTRNQVVLDVQMADGLVSQYLSAGQNLTVTHKIGRAHV